MPEVPRVVLSLTEEPLTDGLGAASGRVVRHTLTLDDGSVTSYVIKELTPLTSGRHAVAARSRDHWAWWQREVLAYRSGFLPDARELRAPRCLLATDNTLYLEDLRSSAEDPHTAACRWGAWQATTELPRADWLTSSQLRQRIAVSELDWRTVDADPRAERLWARRAELLDRFSALEPVLSHGDLGVGNLHRVGDTTVVSDWATLGLAPPGADIAHLTLGTGPSDLLDDYFAETRGRFDRDAVDLAFRIALVLTGSSRVHWMRTQGVEIPDWYVDLLWANQP